MSVLAIPSYANFSGVMHGGELVKILDHVAFSCATKYCGARTITVMIHSVSFKKSIRIGHIMHFLANINYVGKTSMEVGIKVMSEDPRTGEQIHTNSAFFTMLAYENGEKKQVPQFTPHSEEEKLRWEDALKRLANSKSS